MKASSWGIKKISGVTGLWSYKGPWYITSCSVSEVLKSCEEGTMKKESLKGGGINEQNVEKHTSSDNFF